MNFKINFKCSVLFFILCFLMACHPKEKNCTINSHNGITIINKSNKNIRFEIYWNFPDTTIGEYNALGNGKVLIPGDSATRGVGQTLCWEAKLANGKKENLYIFDDDSLKAIPWDTIRATNRGILKRIVFDSLFLENSNYSIIYP
jgi:hypothetical protein